IRSLHSSTAVSFTVPFWETTSGKTAENRRVTAHFELPGADRQGGRGKEILMNAISSSPATPSSTAIDSTLSLASTRTVSGPALKQQPADPSESTDTVDINPARQAQQMY